MIVFTNLSYIESLTGSNVGAPSQARIATPTYLKVSKLGYINTLNVEFIG